MKTLIVILFFLLPPMIVWGQNDTTSIDSLCLIRGHVMGGVVSITDMFCPSFLVETDSTTIKVYPACNWIIGGCMRCGKEITEREPERRVVIWRKD